MNTKHYVRLNEKNEIIKAFSTAFEQPIEGDILIAENGYRHTTEYEPLLQNLIDFETGQYKLKYVNNTIIVKTHDELWTVEVIQNKEIESVKQQLSNLDKYLPRPVEQQYDIQIAANVLTTSQLDVVTIIGDSTLLDIYNQKKSLRNQL